MGFFKIAGLIIGVPTLIAGLYLAWLAFTPVTEDDAETKVSQVCYLGQTLAAFFKPNQRAISCDCTIAFVKEKVGLPALAEGAEFMRVLVTRQMMAALSGERLHLSQAPEMNRAIAMTFAAGHAAERQCPGKTAAM